MPKFSVGDHVVVSSKQFPEQNGLVAIIEDDRALKYSSYTHVGALRYFVAYVDGQDHPYLRDQRTTNVYSDDDLQLFSSALLPEPMFDLDDMELAELLMEDRK